MNAHTWQVGDVKITRIIEIRNLRTPDFVFSNLSREQVIQQAWLQPHFATDDGRLMSFTQAFVIESGERRIIVDTCIGNEKQRRNQAWHDLHNPFLEDLTEAGYSPGSIDTVLCTHMHVDHVGWNTRLVDGSWIPTFPNARYLFGREEWTHWADESDTVLDGDVTETIAQNVLEARVVHQDSIRPIIEAGLHEVVDSTHQLTDEISFEPTPGHTPGHISVRISSRDEHAVITGDLMHHPIQCAMPDVSSNFDFDLARAIATRTDFLSRYADRPVLVLGTHFAGPTAGWVVSHDSTWRFVVDSPHD
tara:strand:- start:156 stop:1070 length:915 start_codon:yes stop_codon:yes gene_type:complete